MLAHEPDPGPHDLFDQGFPGGEVVVDSGRLQLRLVGDITEPGARVAFPAEHVRRRVQDPHPGPCRFGPAGLPGGWRGGFFRHEKIICAERNLAQDTERLMTFVPCGSTSLGPQS